MERKIRIRPNFQGYREDAVSFRTGGPVDQINDRSSFVFEDTHDLTALDQMYRRMVFGDSFPDEMIMRSVRYVGDAVAATLFTSPELTFEDQCSALVNSASMVDQLGHVGDAHIPSDHREVFRSIRSFQSDLYGGSGSPSVEEQHRTLKKMVHPVERYLSSGIPPSNEQPEVSIHTVHEEGPFIAYESEEPHLSYIYRHGYLKGVWFSVSRPEAYIYRKSNLVDFDLEPIGRDLNEREFDDPSDHVGWIESGEEGTSLRSPAREDGTHRTSLDREDILAVLSNRTSYL